MEAGQTTVDDFAMAPPPPVGPSPENQQQLKRQRARDGLLDACLRTVRRKSHASHHDVASSTPGRDGSEQRVHLVDASAGGSRDEAETTGEEEARRRVLKRIIDETLLEVTDGDRHGDIHGESASQGLAQGRRRKVRVGRTGAPTPTPTRPTSAMHSSAVSSTSRSMGEMTAAYPTVAATTSFAAQLEDLELTEDEYLEMILRLEEALYEELDGRAASVSTAGRTTGHQGTWYVEEMEEMDAAEIDAMVEAHLGAGTGSTGPFPDFPNSPNLPNLPNLPNSPSPSSSPLACPVCRQAALETLPGHPYAVYCPNVGGALGAGTAVASLEEVYGRSHCALDLSSEGMGVARVGVRVRVCEEAHRVTGCGSPVRFEVRDVAGTGRMLVAFCQACGWGEVCC